MKIYINENYPEFFQRDSEWVFVKNLLKNDPRPVDNINDNKFTNDGQLGTLLASRFYQSRQLKGFYEQLMIKSQKILNIITKQLHKNGPH